MNDTGADVRTLTGEDAWVPVRRNRFASIASVLEAVTRLDANEPAS